VGSTGNIVEKEEKRGEGPTKYRSEGLWILPRQRESVPYNKAVGPLDLLRAEICGGSSDLQSIYAAEVGEVGHDNSDIDGQNPRGLKL
jgi:hypothetical protein